MCTLCMTRSRASRAGHLLPTASLARPPEWKFERDIPLPIAVVTREAVRDERRFNPRCTREKSGPVSFERLGLIPPRDHDRSARVSLGCLDDELTQRQRRVCLEDGMTVIVAIIATDFDSRTDPTFDRSAFECENHDQQDDQKMRH
jgi:hypothetical protein